VAGNAEKALAPSLGNAVAYFTIVGITYKTGYEFEDPVTAALMMGALAGSGLLFLKSVVLWAGRQIEKLIERRK